MTISGWCMSHGRPDQWHDECERRGLVCGCPNHALNKGIVGQVWENKDEPARCANTRRALTAQLTRANRGDEG